MKIEYIYIKQDYLGLGFAEAEFAIVLDKVLKYIKIQNLKYYYLLCYDDFSNHDLSFYYKDYPTLEEGRGLDCFQIKSEHVDDITFMYKIMSQYHYAYLYVNNDPDFLRFYNPRYKEQEFPKDLGYVIDTDTCAESIGIHKAYDLPSWDLSKLGIDAEEIVESKLI